MGNKPTTDKEKLENAMNCEYKSLISKEEWELVDPSKDCNIVKSKWVFRHKIGEDGSIERYQARLVAQGYLQKQGQDYKEMFSPIVRFESIRTVVALAVRRAYRYIKWMSRQRFSTENFK